MALGSIQTSAVSHAMPVELLAKDNVKADSRIVKMQDLRAAPSSNFFLHCAPRYFEVSSPDNEYMRDHLVESMKGLSADFSTFAKQQKLPKLTRQNLLNTCKEFASDQRSYHELANDVSAILKQGGAEKHSKKAEALVMQYRQGANQTAQAQHKGLVQKLAELKLPAEPLISNKRQTDAVFATDTGQQIGQLYIPASFHNQRRFGEETSAMQFAHDHGLHVQPMIGKDGKDITFEGGDLRQIPGKSAYLMGFGLRSNDQGAKTIAQMAGVDVFPIKMLREDFYHLDCCLCPLPNNKLIMFKGSEDNPTFTKESDDFLHNLYGKDNILYISEKEAQHFATNLVMAKDQLVVSAGAFSKDSMATLKNWGFKVNEVPCEVFHKSGGSIRCSLSELTSQNFEQRHGLNDLANAKDGKADFFDDHQVIDIDAIKRRAQLASVMPQHFEV